MSRARPKSQILATLWSVNRTFLAATSLWMHYTHMKEKMFVSVWTLVPSLWNLDITISLKRFSFILSVLLHFFMQSDLCFSETSSDFVDCQASSGCHRSGCCKESAAFSVLDVCTLKACGTSTHIFGSQKVEALSHLKGKPQQVVNVQWPVNSLLTQRDLGGIRWKQCWNHWK